MKQDKGRGVVVMDRSKYTEKCFNILETEQFTKLRHDPTKYRKQDTTEIKEINNTRISPLISHRLKPR